MEGTDCHFSDAPAGRKGVFANGEEWEGTYLLPSGRQRGLFEV